MKHSFIYKFAFRLKIFLVIVALGVTTSAATFAKSDYNAGRVRANQTQSIPVSGKVSNEKGEPLPGATVAIKGTLRGVITDANGIFTINVPNEAATLQISYIGFNNVSEVVGSRRVIDVLMKETNQELKEIVVVGYGTQKRASITGSVSQITSKQIMEAPIANLSTILAGRLPGLISNQPSGAPGSDDASLLIRGFGTYGNSSPTIIVDGVQRSFNQLDPNEIETITILKDASAAAVYGVQGANGVILITTKRGKAGKAQIMYSSSVSMSQNTMFPKFMDAPQYMNAYNKARILDELPSVFSEDEINKATNGDPKGVWGNTNWVDKLFDNKGVKTHHNLSANGGTDKIRYFVSAGFLNQEGNISNYGFKRYNLRSNIDASVTKNLSLSLNMGGRIEKRNSPYFGSGKNDWMSLVQQAIRAHPYIPEISPNGLPTATRTASSYVNPLAARDLSGTNNSDFSVFQGSLTLKYDVPFVQGLSLKMMASYDRDYTYGKVFSKPYDLDVFEISTREYSTLPSVNGNIALLSEGFSQKTSVNLQPSITFNRVFNNKHDVSALFVYDQTKIQANGFNAKMRGFDFYELPDFAFAKETVENPISGSSSYLTRAGYVGRFNYAYDAKYLFEVVGRYDGSYNFPKNSRWGFFPAASAGWRISNEEFFKNAVPFVNNLKVRASYGQLGNDRISQFLYLRSMQMTTDPVVVIGGQPQFGIFTGPVPNYNITWEKATTWNAGFESQLWHGLLGIEFDWFYKVTKNILTGIGGTYPPSVGGNYPSIVNSGVVDNRGFELVLSHDNTIGDFKYGGKLNLSWSHNRILDINESSNIPDYQRLTGRSIGMKEGLIAQRLFTSDAEAAIYPTVAANAKGGDIRYIDLNGDGKINYDQDRTLIGRSNMPELVGGLNLYGSWKGFDFSTLIQGAAIADFALMGNYPGIGYDNTEFSRSFYHGGNSPVYLINDSWTLDNTNAKYPRLSTVSRPNNNWASTFWIYDASYIRLKTLQIGYTLPKSLTNIAGIEALRFYIAGSNLFTVCKFPYMDPEAPDVNNGYYPQQKNFTIGLNLSF